MSDVFHRHHESRMESKDFQTVWSCFHFVVTDWLFLQDDPFLANIRGKPAILVYTGHTCYGSCGTGLELLPHLQPYKVIMVHLHIA